MIFDRNVLEKNSEEILITKLTNLFGFLSYLSESICTLNLYQISTESIRELKLTASKLIDDFHFIHFNASYILLKSKDKNQQYIASIKSVLVCLMPVNESLSQEAKSLKSNETGDSTYFDIINNEEMQSFLYVIAILSLFTVIFASILLLSYQYNKQDAELYESKIIKLIH